MPEPHASGTFSRGCPFPPVEHGPVPHPDSGSAANRRPSSSAITRA